MELTEQQLADAKSYLEQGKTPAEWMKDNNIDIGPGARPPLVVVRLREKYGKETIQPLMQSMRGKLMSSRVSTMVQNMLGRVKDVEVCDTIIAGLQDSIVLAEAKKAEIQAG